MTIEIGRKRNRVYFYFMAELCRIAIMKNGRNILVVTVWNKRPDQFGRFWRGQ